MSDSVAMPGLSVMEIAVIFRQNSIPGSKFDIPGLRIPNFRHIFIEIPQLLSIIVKIT